MIINNKNNNPRLIELRLEGERLAGLLPNRRELYAYLAEGLAPLGAGGGMGHNLDALYDRLSEAPPCRLVLRGAEALGEGYGARLLACLREAARDNPGLELCLEPEQNQNQEPEQEPGGGSPIQP